MLENKVVAVTGATGGMGRVLCKALAEKGAKLAVTARHEEALNDLKNELMNAYGTDAEACAADLSDENAVIAFMEMAARKYGKLDALVNLAGVSIPGQIIETDCAEYSQMLDINVKSAFLTSKHFAPHAAPKARIVNVGSMAARRTNGNAPLYCMAKSALNTLSEGLAIQLAKRDIRVTTLNPGGADTPFWGDRPVKREKLLQAQDVVDVILFVLEADPRIAIHSIDFESFAMLEGK